MSEIHLFRHGQSYFNKFDIDNTPARLIPEDVSLDSAAPLTSQGEQQAFELGEVLRIWLQDTPSNLITVFMSDWERAARTANIVVTRLNEYRSDDNQVTKQTPDPRLTDQWLGLTEPLYVKNNPALQPIFDDYWARRNSQGPKGRMFEKPVNKLTEEISEIAKRIGLDNEAEIIGENLLDVVARIQNWFNDNQIQRLTTASPSTKSLVFAHGGTTYASRAVFLGESTDEIIEFMKNPESSVGNCARTSYSSIDNSLFQLQNWALTLTEQNQLNN